MLTRLYVEAFVPNKVYEKARRTLPTDKWHVRDLDHQSASDLVTRMAADGTVLKSWSPIHVAKKNPMAKEMVRASFVYMPIEVGDELTKEILVRHLSTDYESCTHTPSVMRSLDNEVDHSLLAKHVVVRTRNALDEQPIDELSRILR